MQYRRLQSPGGTFFFTLVTWERLPIFKEHQKIILLKNAFNYVKQNHPFTIDAFVLLPDHLHCIWTLPKEDKDYSMRWMLIKSHFTRHCLQQDKLHHTQSRVSKREQCIWQRRYWEHQIRNETDFERHVEYIHYNPVKHNYVSAAKDWTYSSFHRYVKTGNYEINWGTTEPYSNLTAQEKNYFHSLD